MQKVIREKSPIKTRQNSPNAPGFKFEFGQSQPPPEASQPLQPPALGQTEQEVINNLKQLLAFGDDGDTDPVTEMQKVAQDIQNQAQNIPDTKDLLERSKALREKLSKARNEFMKSKTLELKENTEITRCTREIDTLKGNVNNLEEQLNKSKSEARDKTREMEELQTKLLLANERLDREKRAFEMLSKETRDKFSFDAEAIGRTYEMKLQAQNEFVNQLNDRLADMHQLYEIERQRHLAWRNHADTLQRNINELEDMVQHHENESNEQYIQRLSRNMSLFQKIKEQFELEKQQTEQQAAKTSSEQTAKLEKFSRETKDLQEKLTVEMQKSMLLEANVKKLQEELNLKFIKIEEQKRNVLELEGSVKFLRSEKDQKQAEINRLLKEKSDIAAALSELKDKFAAQEIDVNELEEALDEAVSNWLQLSKRNQQAVVPAPNRAVTVPAQQEMELKQAQDTIEDLRRQLLDLGQERTHKKRATAPETDIPRTVEAKVISTRMNTDIPQQTQQPQSQAITQGPTADESVQMETEPARTEGLLRTEEQKWNEANKRWIDALDSVKELARQPGFMDAWENNFSEDFDRWLYIKPLKKLESTSLQEWESLSPDQKTAKINKLKEEVKSLEQLSIELKFKLEAIARNNPELAEVINNALLNITSY